MKQSSKIRFSCLISFLMTFLSAAIFICIVSLVGPVVCSSSSNNNNIKACLCATISNEFSTLKPFNVCILHMQNRHSLWVPDDFVFDFFFKFCILSKRSKNTMQAERERVEGMERVKRTQAYYLSKMSPYHKSMVEIENRVSYFFGFRETSVYLS